MNPVWQRKMPRKFHLSNNPKIPAYSWFLTVKARPLANSEWQRYAERFAATSPMGSGVVYMDAPSRPLSLSKDAIVSMKEFFRE